MPQKGVQHRKRPSVLIAQAFYHKRRTRFGLFSHVGPLVSLATSGSPHCRRLGGAVAVDRSGAAGEYLGGRPYSGRCAGSGARDSSAESADYRGARTLLLVVAGG